MDLIINIPRSAASIEASHITDGFKIRRLAIDHHIPLITNLQIAQLMLQCLAKLHGKDVPVRHFGLILNWQDWHNIKDNLIRNKVTFIIDPYIRFKGQKGEQATLFIVDPSLNGIELKSFKEKEMIFFS